MDKKLIKIEDKIKSFLLNELENTIEEEKHLTLDDIEDLAERKDYIENAELKDLLEDFEEEELENILTEEEIEYLKKKGLI